MTVWEYLLDLERLNPDYSQALREEIEAAAEQETDLDFDTASEQVGKIIGMYLDSPPKQAGIAILTEYYALLEGTERKMLAEAETPAEVQEEKTASSCVALVPRSDLPPLGRMEVLSKTEVPQQLMLATDAYRRRNELVDTVVELALRILWRLDAKKACAWVTRYVEAHEGALDPDVLRDILRVCLSRKEALPSDFLKHVIRWCGDAALLENWPIVVFTGDNVLCHQAVRKWMQTCPPRTPEIAHLALLFKMGRTDDSTLLKWVSQALTAIAECISRMMALESGSTDDDLLGGQLFRELHRLKTVYPAVMTVGNQLLCLPDGANQFAMAVFGLAGESLDQWNDALEAFSAKVIRRWFMMDMRTNRSPVETIRRLTFGDDEAFRFALSQLDLVSARFDSPKQRERVIKVLVPFYASYRQESLLAVEITRRFRKIIRLLHHDFLSQRLTPEQMAQIEADDTITELAAMVADARRFLDRRRDRVSPLENVLAARIEFEEATRQRRLNVIRKIIDN